MKVLAFDISSDYAHFRQPYSTTSSLTYAIPPRTAALGIIGAIVGIESGGFGRSEHVAILEKANTKVGIRLMNKIEKTRFNMNYSYTKADATTKNVLHIQVPVEMVRNPVYRLFVTADSELFEKLEGMVINSECYYTPYLGISEFVAKVKYVKTYEALIVETADEIWTAIEMLKKTSLSFSSGQKIFTETHAASMNSQRHVTRYVEVAYEAEGSSLKLQSVDPDSLLAKISTDAGDEVVMLW